METLFQPLQDALGIFLSYLPQLIGAILILIVGYFVARILQRIVARLLRAVGFDGWMERGGVKQFFDRADTNQTPAGILALLVFWFIFIIVLTMAADALGIQQISVFLNQLIAYIPSILAAVLILLLAGLLANFVSGIIRGATGSNLLASVAQYAIIIYAVFAALTELGIAVELTAPTFLIVLGAVALATALAFGIGGREVAREIIEKAYHRGDQEVPGGSSAGNFGGEGGERPEARRFQRED